MEIRLIIEDIKNKKFKQNKEPNNTDFTKNKEAHKKINEIKKIIRE